MNIGTMGAAVIMSGNHTRRMMHGGGGGGSNNNNEDNKKVMRICKWGLLISIVTCISIWCFNVKPDFWYITVEQKIIEKDMLQSEGSKGKIYDTPFIKVETQYIEDYGRWSKADTTLWIHCTQKDFLNYKVGHIVKEEIVNPDYQGWSTFLTFLAWMSGFISICFLSAILAMLEA